MPNFQKKTKPNQTIQNKKQIENLADRDSKDKDKDKPGSNQLAVPRLSVCADAQKVDRAKLAQTEFNIIEFDPDTFRVLLDYLHTGTCPLTCVSIPGKWKVKEFLRGLDYGRSGKVLLKCTIEKRMVLKRSEIESVLECDRNDGSGTL